VRNLWRSDNSKKDCFGVTLKPTRETRALPRRATLRLLDFSRQEPAEIGKTVEVTQNLDVEVLVVVHKCGNAAFGPPTGGAREVECG
jgi:hypothetical protein